MPTYLLVDNGSKQPQATLALRRLAQALSEQSGRTVHPVSLQHAGAIPPQQLQGIPARLFSEFLQAGLEQGEDDFIVLPLFFGPSKALTSFIPDEVARLRHDYPGFTLQLANPIGSDVHMATVVHQHIEAARHQAGKGAGVVLVDHGSPSPQITEVRKAIVQRVHQHHGLAIDQACMERREGSRYDFNGQLLDNWLRSQAEAGIESVIIAMLFFLPGRHAGPCGDVEEICEAVLKDHPQLRYTITPLISEHPLLLEILESRLQALEARGGTGL